MAERSVEQGYHPFSPLHAGYRTKTIKWIPKVICRSENGNFTLTFYRKRNRIPTDHTCQSNGSCHEQSLPGHHNPHYRSRTEGCQGGPQTYHQIPRSDCAFSACTTCEHPKNLSSVQINGQRPHKKARLMNRFRDLFRTRRSFARSDGLCQMHDAVWSMDVSHHNNDVFRYQSSEQQFNPFGVTERSEQLDYFGCEIFEMPTTYVCSELESTPPKIQEVPTNSNFFIHAQSGAPVPELNTPQGFNANSPPSTNTF